MSEAGPKVIPHRATGYRPIHEQSLQSLRDLLADAESGKVTAFAFVAAGPDFAYWLSRTKTTRQDRVSLIGQMTLLQRELMQDDDAALNRGE